MNATPTVHGLHAAAPRAGGRPTPDVGPPATIVRLYQSTIMLASNHERE